ncbi:MAG: CHRD domain-containing protein [Bryobacteraceae bacterium]
MRTSFALLVAAAICVIPGIAQNTETYRLRLAPVATDIAMRENIAGSGLVTATLAGSKLTLAGTFEGMKGNATMAHIHQGTAPGVRGPKLLDVTITKAMNGNLSGTFDLTPENMEALKKGKWYIQIHSEKAPDGNLWGWIVK